jgi:hypothetical protein
MQRFLKKNGKMLDPSFIFTFRCDRSHKLWNTLSTGRYILSIPYAGYAGMLLNINGMFIMREVVVKFRSEPALTAKIMYSRVCGSYQEIGLQLTGKLLNPKFLVVKLK